MWNGTVAHFAWNSHGALTAAFSWLDNTGTGSDLAAAHSASGALGFVLRFTGSLNAADDTFLPKTSAVPSR